MVGLRPYRAAGFRLAAETIGGAVVIHNCGHGGGGVTLSWGTAAIGCELGPPVAGQACAVTGAGAVGLATAHTLQERGAGQVTIYADAVSPGTTSDAAGAQIWPSSVFDGDAIDDRSKHLYERAAAPSFRRFATLAGTGRGVWWQTNYALSAEPPRPAAADADRALSLGAFCVRCGAVPPDGSPFRTLHASRFDTAMAAPPIYLPALAAEIRARGGRFVGQWFATGAELGRLPERIVFNCSGLGARALVGDASLEPLKGQLTILRPQPEVRYNAITASSDMFARPDGIALGGLEDRGNWSLAFDATAEDRILADQAHVADDLVDTA